MEFIFCFLAHGEEHIEEFNIVAESLLKINKNFKIFVGTDEPSEIIDGIYNTILIQEEFNFNLKRIIIEEALKEVDTIIFLDTDIFIRNGIDFSVINNLDNNTIYADEIVNLLKLKDAYGSLDYMQEYLDILTPMIDTPLFLIHEGLFILKTTNETKDSFLNNWKEIDLQTRPYQKMAYGVLGAMEGLIIYISLINSGIKIELAKDDIRKLYSNIAHFGSRGRKLIKTII
jgi:hypothetical protein